MDLLSAYSLISIVTYFWIQLCSASDISYADYCASIVPESTMQYSTGNQDSLPRFPQSQAGFFLGGNTILGPSFSGSSKGMNFLTLTHSGISWTDIAGLFKLDTSLMLRRSTTVFNAVNYTNGYWLSDTLKHDPVDLWLTGFWSETSGKLCMVGTGTGLDQRGKTLFLRVVLKLSYVSSPSITNSLITGTLESISSAADRNYFEPISVLAFSHLDYVYTLSAKDMDHTEADGSDELLNFYTNRPLISLPGGTMCFMLSSTSNLFQLMHTSSCELTNNCFSFRGIDLNTRSLMSFDKFSCDEENKRVRAMINFHNNAEFYRADNLEASLIAEGIWDASKNRLVFKACRFDNISGSLYDVSIGDCSIRISLRFPAIWSIYDSSAVLGRIWSSKLAQDLHFFREIKFTSNNIRMAGIRGLKYEYSQIEKVRNHCFAERTVKNPAALSTYPDGNSDEMKFGILVKSSKSRFAFGSSQPLFVNDFHYEDFSRNTKVAADFHNISYRIGFTQIPGKIIPEGVASLFSKFNGQMTALISAEGIYESATGSMCMIGCRRVPGNNSADCDILVKFQFPPLGASNSTGYINGSIDSLRDRSDPLYFDYMDLSSTSFVLDVAKRQVASSKSKMNILVASKVLGSISVLVQLLYVIKQPKLLPFISTLMLVVLAFSSVVPLVLSFNLQSSHSHGSSTITLQGMSGWVQLEASEILTAVDTFIGFLLLLRLVHLTWKSRSGQSQTLAERNKLWIAERKSLLSFILLYLIGALGVTVTRVAKDHGKPHHQIPSVLFQDLRLYSTLFQDLLFLVPQVFFNTFYNSKQRPLSYLFYIGITFSKLMPYLSDTIFENSGDLHPEGVTYLMACLGIFLDLIIFLQQKFGGSCILTLLPCKPRVDADTASTETNEVRIELTT